MTIAGKNSADPQLRIRRSSTPFDSVCGQRNGLVPARVCTSLANCPINGLRGFELPV